METKERNIHQGLIGRCRKNDKDAQFELYKLYYKPMYNTSLRILNNTAEAEDVMQESFLTAFSRIESYSGEGNFGAWLRRIVVNNSIDALKARKPELFFDSGQIPEMENEPTHNSEDAEYKVARIKEAMNHLPEDHRVVISLFLFEGYDHEEIAQILEISYNAARTRYSRAKQKLLKILSEQKKFKSFNPN